MTDVGHSGWAFEDDAQALLSLFSLLPGLPCCQESLFRNPAARISRVKASKLRAKVNLASIKWFLSGEVTVKQK